MTFCETELPDLGSSDPPIVVGTEVKIGLSTVVFSSVTTGDTLSLVFPEEIFNFVTPTGDRECIYTDASNVTVYFKSQFQGCDSSGM